MLFDSCSSGEKEDLHPEARELFKSTEILIRETINKVSQAKDSITLDSLIDNFDKRMTDVNFSFPPQTDLYLTEQENDSIIKLLQALRIRKEENYSILSRVLENTDTI